MLVEAFQYVSFSMFGRAAMRLHMHKHTFIYTLKYNMSMTVAGMMIL